MTIRTPKTEAELDALLRPMQLRASTIEQAVAVGAAESRTFSPGAPKSAPEITRWIRTVEAFHGELMLQQDDWKRFDPDNLPYFSQPSLNIGVVISSGNEFTGTTYGTPSTRNAKGTAFADRVDVNGAVALVGQYTSDGVEVVIDSTWVLLYDERQGRVYVELSLPTSMKGKQVDVWAERIIIPPFDIAAGRFTYEDGNASDHAFVIERIS